MTAHALALLLVAIAADKPSPADLAEYKARAKEYQEAKLTDLLTNMQTATGSKRKELQDRIAAHKKAPPAPPLYSTKPGSIGTLKREFTVVEVYPDGKAKLGYKIAVYDTDEISGTFSPGFGNRVMQHRQKIGEKDGKPIIIETPEAAKWKAGEVVTLPANKPYWVKPDGSLAPLPK